MLHLRSSIAADGLNANLQSELVLNDSIDKQVTQELAKQKEPSAQTEVQLNRARLNLAYQAQKTNRARNVVNNVGSNWGDAVEPQQQAANTYGQFNSQWIEQNNFRGATVLKKANRKVADKSLSEGQAIIVGGQSAVRQPSATQVVQALPQVPQAGDFTVNAPGERVLARNDLQQRFADGKSQAGFGLAGRYSNSMDQTAGYGPARAVPPGGMGGMGGGLSAAATPAATAPAPPAKAMVAAANPTPAPESPAPQTREATPPGLDEATTVAKPKPAPQANTGLASLDFELPAADASRWTLYRFTTPRGDEQITGRDVANDLLLRLVEIIVAAAAIVVLWAAVKTTSRGRFDWLATPLAAAVLIALGVVSLCAGLAPIVGVAAIVAGAAVLVRRSTSPATKPLGVSQQSQ